MPPDRGADGGRPRLTPVGVADIIRIRGLACYPNVHVLLSGQYAVSLEDHPYGGLVTAARLLYRSFGAERLIWGSDFPFVAGPGYALHRDWVRLALPHLTGAERALVLGANVGRLFPA